MGKELLSCRSLIFTRRLLLVTALMEQDCLFCRIVAGEIPSDIIYQDERSIAFRDINPQAPVHVLVVPREHMESLDEASQKDEAMLGHLLRVAARIANEQGLSESGYRTVVNTGAGVGQSVFHLHVHLLGGRPMSWPPG
jgi:histidine triad (HIT) family protein